MTSTAATTERAQPGPTPDPDTVGAREQLRWLSLLWVFGIAFHHTDGDITELWLVLLTGAPLLFFPTSVPLFALFVAVNTALAATKLPGIANHMMLSLLVGLGFGASALYVLLSGRFGAGAADARSRLSRWLDTARTPVGLTLLVVYAFTVFHKLNTAFLSADSCAEDLFRRSFEKNGLPVITLHPPFVQAFAVGTIIVETAILVCLAVPRWRRWGILLGVGFHAILGFASFFDFATIVFALYLLFVPTRVFAGLAERAAKLWEWALIAFAGHVAISLVSGVLHSRGIGGPGVWHLLQVITWALAVLPVMVLLIRAVFADQAAGGAWPGWKLRGASALLLFVPVLAFVNGATPYVGLKTTANYSMFSNLHVEGGATNHLVPGVTALQVAPYTRDLVTVYRIDEPHEVSIRLPQWIREQPPYVVPMLELRRLVDSWRDEGATGKRAVAVEYEQNGVRHVVPDVVADPVLGAPMPWWQSRLLTFRAFDSRSGADICRW
jgi:hypothetical protein